MSIIKPDSRGGVLVLVRHADDTRHWHHLDVTTEEEASAAYERVKAKIREERKTTRKTIRRAKGKGPTFREWVEKIWSPSRKAKGHRDDEARASLAGAIAAASVAGQW